MADQHNPNIPALTNQISADIPDIKENLEFHKDVFENFVNSWSNTDATGVYPAYWERTAIVTGDSPYTMLAADIIIEVDASGGAVEVDLVAAATYAKRYVIIKCTDSTNNVTIDPNGAETIDGVSSKVLYEDDQCIMIYSDGTNWQTLFFYGAGTLVENDTYIKAVNAAGDGTVNLIKANASDEAEFGAQASALLAEQAAAPSTAASQGVTYTKDYHGQTELYYREESDGDEVLMTNRGFAPLPQGWKYGMELSNAVGDTDHDILIQTGAVRDSTDVTDLRLAATMIKRIDAAWTSGSANGGLMFTTVVGNTHNGTAVLDGIPDTSHIKVGMSVTGTGVGVGATVSSIDSGTQITVSANSTADGVDITFTFGIAPSVTYHFFAIRSDITGATDAGFDTSFTCANIPADYTYYRRIGSMKTDASSNILNFFQVGNVFRLYLPVLEVNVVAHAYTTRTLSSVPTGHIVEAFGNIKSTGDYGQVRPVGASDGNASITVSPLSLGSTSGKWHCITNTSAQISTYQSAGTTPAFRLTVEGWRDFF